MWKLKDLGADMSYKRKPRPKADQPLAEKAKAQTT